MKKIITCLFILQTFGSFADQTALFSLTAEEMVFASKLSDENRHLFCYKLSLKERLTCLEEAQKEDISCSLDQIVEGFAKSSSLEKSFLR
ncbi:MAG: hypothetical protein V4489_10130 [Chlamydiota bacterium]